MNAVNAWMTLEVGSSPVTPTGENAAPPPPNPLTAASWDPEAEDSAKSYLGFQPKDTGE